MAKQKRHMTHDEEFKILTLVLDKFLWLGVAIMAFGFYQLITVSNDLTYGLMILGAGAIVLIIFIAILMREYNFLSNK
ncbi:hypothetical protein JW711_04800 [Candidatus Woesearchaeota archaeon]|nr:hypothetical protein [Candidatus Woesearchaeota archaeon]